MKAGHGQPFEQSHNAPAAVAVAGRWRPRNGLVLLNGDTPDLYFARQPEAVELLLGSAGELVAEVIGSSAVAYQWSKDGAPLVGETRPVLRLANASAATIGNYRVVARNTTGELASLTARVEVVLPRVIVAPPRRW